VRESSLQGASFDRSRRHLWRYHQRRTPYCTSTSRFSSFRFESKHLLSLSNTRPKRSWTVLLIYDFL